MKCFLITISFLCTLIAKAQQPDITFHHITQKDGLSYNIINTFLKDSRGMLWIGTYNGLNKYDGEHFYVYRKGSDKNTLPNNTVHELAEDKQGNIWGATDGGIFCMNTVSVSFKSINIPESKNGAAVYNIYCDKTGDIWATNMAGLLLYNKKVDSFEIAPCKGNPINNGKGFLVRKNGLAESPDGKGFWMTTRMGMLYYDKIKQQYTSSQNNNDFLFAPISISAICPTPYGHYWFFDNTKMQLVCFDPLQKKILHTIQSKQFTPASNAATIFEDKNHLLWICTWNYEVFTIDLSNGNKITSIKHDDNNISTIAGDFFWDAKQDADGTMWLGTVGGISTCNTKRSFYKVHYMPKSTQPSGKAQIEFIAENKLDSTWWLVNSDKKLVHYNPTNAKTESYNLKSFAKNKNFQTPDYITNIIFFKNKVMLVSGFGTWIKQGSGSFQPLVLPAPADTISIKLAVLTNNDSILYCTDYKKVLRWNLHNGKLEFLHLSPGATIKENPYLFTYLTARPGTKIWMLLAPDWLGYVEGNNIVPVKFSSIEKDGNNGYYSSMDIDADGNLWITKKGDGLFYYNPTQKKYRLFKESDGMVMDHVMAVAAGQNGKIWTGAYNQFSIYTPLMNSFYNFTLPVSTNSYDYVNHIASLKNGNIIASIANDIVEFFPSKLKQDAVNEQPIISMLKAGGREKILEKNSMVELEPTENSLQIKFGLLTDIETSPYDMLYKLEGAENEWTTANNIFEASYNSLPPGNYIFKVKALAKDKSWQTRETEMKFKIRTPFYKAWWFNLLLIAVFLTSIFLLYRYRINQKEKMLQLESKAQLLEKEKTMVLYESLKQQLNPHFLFNSLTSLSGLIEADQKMAGNFLEQMSKIYRYILKSSETETVLLKEELQFTQLYVSLQTTRFEKGLEVTFNVPSDVQHYRIVPVTLQNMIENAIKHNIIDVDAPLVINIFIEGEYLVVKNNLQKKNKVETSNKQGLKNLKNLYTYLSPLQIIVQQTDSDYEIKIPLI